MIDSYWFVTEQGYEFTPQETAPEWPLVEKQLEMLYAEGKAELFMGNYSIPHEQAVELDPEIKALLDLPDTFPYAISIRSKGNTTSPDFSYEIEYLKPNRQRFIGLKPIGSYIQIDEYKEGTAFMFSRDQYRLISTINECNTHIKELKSRVECNNYNLRGLAKIQEYAKNTEASLDNFIRNQKIVTADKLSVHVKKNPDGSYIVIPVLLKKENDTYEPITVEEFDDAFQRAPLNARTFVGRDRTKYVFTDDQAESIQDIQDKYRKVSREKAEEIMRFPKETFDSDVFSFDLSLYGDRVEEIGAYEKRSLPYIQPEANNWLPPEGSTAAEMPENTEDLDFVTPENVVVIHYKIQEAQEQGKEFIEFEGKSIPVTPDLIDKVAIAMEKATDDMVGKPANVDKTEIRENKEKQELILKIKENLESRGYISQILEHQDPDSIGAQLKEVLLHGLRDTIRPMPHQIAGITQMAKCWLEGHRGVLLADDMGLGKTMQAFGFISAIKALVDDTHESMDSVLIVAPVSLLENWQEEYYKFVRSVVK